MLSRVPTVRLLRQWLPALPAHPPHEEHSAILYVELWNARPTWLALSQQQRGEYMAQLAPAIGQLLNAGVEIVGWGINDAETPYRSNHQYLAVWKLPDQSAVSMLEATVEGAGWHRYFEQVNVRGVLQSPEPVIGHMIGL